LENRIFIIEEDLTALVLQQAISSWKMILLLVLWVFCQAFSNVVNLDSVAIAAHAMKEQPKL